MRPLLLGVLFCCALPLFAQHDITQVETASPESAISTPTPSTRGWKKYDVPDLAGAQQAIGPQLLDGRLRKPLMDFLVSEGLVEQRVSIFEGGLVVVNMTGAATIRKKMLIPQDALDAYIRNVSPARLRTVDTFALTPPDRSSRGLLRVYEDDGRHVERLFNPSRVLPKDLNDQIAPLRDLLRAVSEDRDVTSSVAGYEPKPGDELVADDQKVYRVVRVVEGANVVELKCLSAPTSIYVAKKDLHLYFIGASKR
jgi:hypothetical protein